MSESTHGRSLSKRVLLAIGGIVAFMLVFVVAVRFAVNGIYRGIEANRATGLASISPFSVARAYISHRPSWGSDLISKSASLDVRTDKFEDSVRSLDQVVAIHHGYLEELKRQSHSGYGRSLAADIVVPSTDYEPALSDLKSLGRVESTAEEGEDSAVKIAAASRHLASAQTNLSRLQKLQRERKGGLSDAVALEKDIAHANEAVNEAQRESQGLLSTVSQAHIRLSLMEEYRPPLRTDLASLRLQLRNSLVEGVDSVFSTAAAFVAVSFEYGLPLLFWGLLLAYPTRLAWRRFRRFPAAQPVAQ